jgi:hypothetical protein
MVAETNPNHVAMVTGAYGKDSGISGNTFGVYGAQAKRDCPGDGGSTDPTPEDQQPGGGAVQVTSGEAATCLRAETFFAALKRLAPDVVTAGIFGKPKLARIFETKRIDPRRFDAGPSLRAVRARKRADPPYCKNDPDRPRPALLPTTASSWTSACARSTEGVRADGRDATPAPARSRTSRLRPGRPRHGGAAEAYTRQIGVTDMADASASSTARRQGLWGADDHRLHL